MATADQIRALIQSFHDRDDPQFYAVALQLAAQEARRGNAKLADDIRQLVLTAKAKPTPSPKTVALHQPRGDLGALLHASYPATRLVDLVADTSVVRQLERVLREQRNVGMISSHGLSPRRKILLVGPPGTGKTLTASALAGELGLPLFAIRLDVLITKFMGETASRLRQVFDAVSLTRGVYFFDEFDAIGSQRDLPNEVGEARRILNSFLQMLEQDTSHSLILAATNHADILDTALIRRFDDVIQYASPSMEQIEILLRRRLTGRLDKKASLPRLVESAFGLSFAEIAKAIEDAIKDALILGKSVVSEAQLKQMLDERRTMQSAWKRR